MKILITGGLGFIGCSLTKELMDKHRIIILDKDDYNGKRYFKSGNLTYVIGDVCDEMLAQGIFEKNKFDGIIHLAAISRVVTAENNPAECLRTNVGGVENILNVLNRSRQNPWLIFGSSREVYGEPKADKVLESDLKKPINIYGESKLKGEALFKNFAQTKELSCAVLRFSNVYGNRYDIKDRVLPRFIRAIANNETVFIEGGKQIIDFTHIDDTVHSILKTIDYINSKFVIDEFHILPGIGWSLYQAIEYLENILGVSAKVTVNPKRNYDVEKFVGNNSKAKTTLKLRDFYNLKDGLELAVKEYLEV